MPAMETSMDTVLEYLESISDMDNLSNNLENSQQLIEDLDIVTDWINDLLDLGVIFLFDWYNTLHLNPCYLRKNLRLFEKLM